MAKSIARFLADVASTTGVLDGTLSTAAQPNITSVGTLSSLTISGNLNATLTTAAQTNVTSLGTLSSLNLSGALTGTTGTFTTADNLTQVRLISTDADASIGPRLDLFRNSASPAAGDFIGRVRFLGEDSTGAETAYVHFDSIINDPTDGSEDGQLRIETKTNGSMNNRIKIESSETVINEDNIDVDFRVETDNKTHMLFVDSSTNRVGINTSSPDQILHIEDNTIDGEVSAKVVNTNSGSSAFAGLFLNGDGNNFRIKNWGDGTSNANATEFNSTAGSSHFIFSPGNSEAMRINNDGTVDFTNHIDLPDSKYVRLGDAADFILYHDGTSNYVQAVKQDSDIIFRGNDGGTGTNMLTLDTSAGGRAKFNSDATPLTDGVGKLGLSTLRWAGLQVKSTESEAIKFTIEDTTAATAMIGVRLDMDISGSDATGGDRANYGQYISLNSTATGGDTADEHRLYGVRSLAKATGDSDLIYGGFFTGEAEHSSGTVSGVYGSYNQATGDPNSGGTVSNVYSTHNLCSVVGSAGSTVTNAYASYNKLLVGTSDEVAHSTLHGVYSEIETDTSGTGRTTDNGFLYRGIYDDDSGGEHKFTNFYGLHLSGTNLSTRTDGTGTVAGVYLDMPGVEAGFWNSEDQPNYFRGSLGIGSGSRQVGATVGAELHLVEPDGGDMCLVRYDSTTQSNNSLGKIFWGSTENSGTTVNFSASIEGYAQTNHSTTDSDGYLLFKTTPNSSTTLTERMRIKSDGKVGIGTDSPGTKLEVYDGSLTLHAPSSTGNAWTYYKNSDRIYLVGIRGSASDVLSFYDLTADAQRMQINTSGSIGAPTGTNIYNASDERLKQNISSLDNSLETIKNLNPVKFNWIDNFVEEENGKTLYGFIAQEVQDVFPDAIEPFADGKEIIVDDKVIGNPLTVREKFLVPMLVKAMQEQQTQIEALQAEVAALKGS